MQVQYILPQVPSQCPKCMQWMITNRYNVVDCKFCGTKRYIP